MPELLIQLGIKPPTAKALAELIQHDASALRIMTSEYFDTHIVSTLVGNEHKIIMALTELMRRATAPQTMRKPLTYETIASDLRPYTAQAQETYWVYSLDSRSPVPGIISRDLVYRGLRNNIAISPADIFHVALMHGATRVLLAHTHCNDEPNPSTDDLSTALALQPIGDLLELPIVDHCIVSRNGFWSMAQAGLL